MFENKRVIDLRDTGTTGGGGGTTPVTEDHRIIEIEGMFKEAYSTMAVEYTYNGEQLSGIDVWVDVSKLNKLFEKRFIYNVDKLQQTVLTDLKSGYVLTVTFTYSGDQLVSKYRSIV